MIEEIPQPQNPFALPNHWTEDEPWDIINCFKCEQSWKVPSSLYDVWVELELGCPHCFFVAMVVDEE